MNPITVDFETEAIVGNPLVHPPRPFGVAVWVPGEEPYFTEDMSVLRNFWGKNPMLFHNGPFDVRVAEVWLDLPFPRWDLIHDTQYLIYLNDPYAESLSLKPSAERILGDPPDEQDELYAWITRNIPEATQKNAGAFISQAPRDLVARYAVGDVVRTRRLFDRLYPDAPVEAYDRERRLMPMLVRGTQRGIRVARGPLEQALERAEQALEQADNALRATLQAPTLEPGKGASLAQALDAADMVTGWDLTPTGKKSVNKKSLVRYIKDPEIVRLLNYRGTLSTYISTFMRPWLGMSEHDGRLHPNWNQVRSTEGFKKGTRTGRLSSDKPNFQNVPTEYGAELPEGFDWIPSLRQFLLPEEGHVWVKRDFSGQEVRVAAHFAEGRLLDEYRRNPALDPHQLATELINSITGLSLERKLVKIIAFQIIYGGGGGAVASALNVPREQGFDLKDAYLRAMPELKMLMDDASRLGKLKRPVLTWGGREFYAEPPKMVKGKCMTFEYKLCNYLIQGSAADQTKQCLIDWEERRDASESFLATVHDEINISVPEEVWERGMATLREVMDQELFDCPMRSEGFMGPNWHDMEEVE